MVSCGFVDRVLIGGSKERSTKSDEGTKQKLLLTTSLGFDESSEIAYCRAAGITRSPHSPAPGIGVDGTADLAKG